MRTPRHILRRPLPLSAFVRLSAFSPFKNVVDKNTALCYTHVMIRMLPRRTRLSFLPCPKNSMLLPPWNIPFRVNFMRTPLTKSCVRGPILRDILLLDGDTPAGYALLQKTYSREAGGLTIWIDEIYLRPAFRGKGLAKELFALAHTLGAKRLRLEVEPENTRANRYTYRSEARLSGVGISLHGQRPFRPCALCTNS